MLLSIRFWIYDYKLLDEIFIRNKSDSDSNESTSSNSSSEL